MPDENKIKNNVKIKTLKDLHGMLKHDGLTTQDIKITSVTHLLCISILSRVHAVMQLLDSNQSVK